MFDRLKEDINAVKARDPAARSSLEIFFLYPGLRAVRMHRRANFFYRHGHKFIARYISPKGGSQNRYRNTSRRHHRKTSFHRPRNRCCYRRNGRDRRRRDHISGRYPRRNRSRHRQTPPNHRKRRAHRLGRQGARSLQGGGQFPHRRGCGGFERNPPTAPPSASLRELCARAGSKSARASIRFTFPTRWRRKSVCSSQSFTIWKKA